MYHGPGALDLSYELVIDAHVHGHSQVMKRQLVVIVLTACSHPSASPALVASTDGGVDFAVVPVGHDASVTVDLTNSGAAPTEPIGFAIAAVAMFPPRLSSCWGRTCVCRRPGRRRRSAPRRCSLRRRMPSAQPPALLLLRRIASEVGPPTVNSRAVAPGTPSMPHEVDSWINDGGFASPMTSRRSSTTSRASQQNMRSDVHFRQPERRTHAYAESHSVLDGDGLSRFTAIPTPPTATHGPHDDAQAHDWSARTQTSDMRVRDCTRSGTSTYRFGCRSFASASSSKIENRNQLGVVGPVPKKLHPIVFAMCSVLLGLVVVGCGSGAPQNNPDALATTDTPPDATNPVGADGECRDGWCWVYPLQGNRLDVMWTFSPTDIWLAGYKGTFLHFDGTAWKGRYLAGFVGNVTSLYGGAPNDLWASGDKLLHWDGTAWTIVDGLVPADVDLRGGPANTVFAFGDAGDMYRYDGTAWTEFPSPGGNWHTADMKTIDANTYAISTTGGLAQWTGTDWGIIDAGMFTNFDDVVLVDGAHFVAVKNASQDVWRWNGTSWSTLTPPIVAGRHWDDVEASSFNDIWVFGGTLDTTSQAYAHWDGSTWIEGTLADYPGNEHLYLDPSNTMWLVSEAEVRKWNGATFVTVLAPADLTDVFGFADNDIWVTTRDCSARHWNGTSWTEIATPYSTAQGCTAIGLWGTSSNDLWMGVTPMNIVDAENPMVVLHWNGTAWSTTTVTTLPSWVTFEAIWGSSSADIYAGWNQGVFHYDGTSWTPIGALTSDNAGDVIFGFGPADVYIGNASSLRHWDGTTWTSKTAPAGASVALPIAPTDMWIGSSHYDGTFFEVIADMSADGRAIGGANDVWIQQDGIVGWQDAMQVHYAGGWGGTTTSTPAFFPHGRSWQSPSGKTYVIGNGGLLVHD
jgi:hypothetical protein